MTEELKDIKEIEGYEGLYAITRNGKVWSYKRNKFLKPSLDKDGYPRVILHKEGKIKNFRIHRLVAQTFIPNPDNLPQVNHKDENKTNNCVSNLEWCTAKYNNNYGTRIEKLSKSIYCIELDKTFKSGAAAGRELGLEASSILKCCKGIYKTSGGYHWRYAEASIEEI